MNEHVSKIISLLPLLAAIVGIIIWGIKQFELRKAKVKEKSVGAAKVQELEKADSDFRKDLQFLTREVETLKSHNERNEEKYTDLEDKLEALEGHYNKLIDKVWDFFSKK